MEDFLRTLSNKTYPLSPLDVIPSHLYISNVFFFENATPSSTKPFMPADALRASFYDALQKFPILVGYLRRRFPSSMEIVVDRNEPNMPSYRESECSSHFGDLKKSGFRRDSWPEGVNVKDPRAVATDGAVLKLVCVHVFRMAANSGVAIRIRISHSVFDAKGVVAFINHWAQMCRKRLDPQASISFTEPLIDRSIMYAHLPASSQPREISVSDPRHWLFIILSLLLQGLLSLYAMLSPKQAAPDDIESHLFRIKRSTLDNIKQSTPEISDNDIITALFTMAFAQSTEKVASETLATTNPLKRTLSTLLSRKNKTISAIVPCDFRHRISVPQNYTGSCAIGLYVTAPLPDLLTPITPASLTKIALLSRKTISTVSITTISTFITRALRAVSLVGSKANILYSFMVCQAFSNQSRLGFYDVDFGSGKPVMVAPMAYSNTVAVVFPWRGEGDLGVFLTLRPGVMGGLLGIEEVGEFVERVY